MVVDNCEGGDEIPLTGGRETKSALCLGRRARRGQRPDMENDLYMCTLTSVLTGCLARVQKKMGRRKFSSIKFFSRTIEEQGQRPGSNWIVHLHTQCHRLLFSKVKCYVTLLYGI